MDVKWIVQGSTAVSGQSEMWSWGAEIKELVQGQVNGRKGSNPGLQTSTPHTKDKLAACEGPGTSAQAPLKFCPHVQGNHTWRIWRKEGSEYSYGDLSVTFELKKLLR